MFDIKIEKLLSFRINFNFITIHFFGTRIVYRRSSCYNYFDRRWLSEVRFSLALSPYQCQPSASRAPLREPFVCQDVKVPPGHYGHVDSCRRPLFCWSFALAFSMCLLATLKEIVNEKKKKCANSKRTRYRFLKWSLRFKTCCC